MSERLNKVHLIICTIAAVIIAIGFIAVHVYDVTHGLFTMAMWVSISIVLFYFIGHMVRAFLINRVFTVPEEDEGEDGVVDILDGSEGEEVVVDSPEESEVLMFAPDDDGGNGSLEEENGVS